MTDIDFDELDKAVNTLMGKAVSNDPDDIIQEKNLNINSTLKPGEKPTYDRLGEVAKGIGSETLLTEGEHTVMGDSKLPTLELSGAESNDTVVTLTPAPTVTPPAQPPVPSLAAQRPTGGRAMDVVRASPYKRAATTMPSLVSPDRIASDASVAPEPEAIKPNENNTVTPTPTENTEAQRLTPFLPDTKVEKRPLGTNDPVTTTGAVESPFNDAAETDGKTDAVNDADGTSDIGENKSDDSGQKPLDATETEAKPSPEELKLLEIESAEVSEDVPTAESVRAVESGDTEKLNNGSISQQYKTKESETSDAAGAIYDVKDYHQALGHPTKQKSGWGTVLLIIVIVIACAIIGAAVYFILGAGL